jgi:MYXO-CTERM domain-containing protein
MTTRIVSLAVLSAVLACEATQSGADPSTPRAGTLADGSLAGTYVARIARQDDGRSRLTHHLVLEDRDIELVVTDPLVSASQPAFERGTWLQVWGDADGTRRMLVDDWSVLAPAPEPLVDAEPFDPRVIATILLFWDEPGLNNGNADQSMFSGPEATSVYYGEVSYGRERVIGEVFGPYEIPDPGGCDPYSIGLNAREAMLDKGHNPNDYRQLMYHFPSTGCDFGGLADLGSPQFPARDSWYHGSFGCTVRNQEIGHNYGMGHSHAYNCGMDENGEEIVFADNCAHVEYGDPFDPMGDGCGHINAVQKVYMGWIDDCNILYASADGTFNIAPLETPCDGTQVLVVPAFDGRSYWLEYRQPLGDFDAAFDGVVVHVSEDVDAGGFGPAPYFLEVGGTGLMQAGDSFTDPMGVVTFTVDEQNPTHAVVSVTFPDGGSGAPVCRGGGEPGAYEGAIGVLECSAAPYPADDTPPVVTITYPADGEVFAPGSDFTITAEATDDRIISDLELYLDGEPVVRLFEEPWAWDVSNIAAGEYELGVVARDGRNMGLSQAVTIVVGTPDDADTSGGESTTAPIDADTSAGGDTSSGGPAQDQPVADGCGCAQREGSGGAMLLGVVLLGLRRRRYVRSISAIRALM